MVEKGTDSEIFGEDQPLRITNGPEGGRPRINRDLARRLFQAGFTPSQVAKKLNCHVVTARNIRRELEEAGELKTELREEGLNLIQADFDEECKMAIGISFADWLKTKTVAHRRIFNFCQRCWTNIWKKPSLVLTKDTDNKLGDQLCMAWLDAFGEDLKRIRGRKKLIRYLFRFLGRHDLCDRYLTMTQSRDPRPIRRIPQIEMIDFPETIEAFLDGLEEIDPEMKVATMLKLTTQMRTGNKNKQRALMGITVGKGKSYLIMNSPDEFRFRVLEKMREEWDITWLPRELREDLWELYQRRDPGEHLFSFTVRRYRRAMKKMSKEHLGLKMTPHDMRKISITWLYVMGVPLELAVMINVGWKDLNTPKDHYLHMRNLLKKSDRKAYRENIPEWFKEGLDEYIET